MDTWLYASTLLFPPKHHNYIYAQNVLIEAIQQIPNNPHILFYLALSLQYTNKYTESIFFYQKLLEIDPLYRNQYEVYGNIATAYHALGKYEEAIYAYKIAVNKNSTSNTDNTSNSNTDSSNNIPNIHNIHATGSPNVVILSNYALCLCTLSRYTEGLLILERAKEVCSTIEYDTCMGTIYGTGAIPGIDSKEGAEIDTVPEIVSVTGDSEEGTGIDSGKEGESRIEIINADLLRAIKACSI